MADIGKDFHKLAKKRKLRWGRILTPLLMIIIIVSVIYFLKDLGEDNSISIVVIRDNECTICSDPGSIVELIKESEGVDIGSVEELDYRDEKAQQLLVNVRAKTVPIIIVQGNAFAKTLVFQQLAKQDIEKHADKFVISNFLPPLVDIETGEIVGKVSAIKLVDNGCGKCSDLNNIVNKFKELGVYIDDVKDVGFESDEGKELVEKYKIERVPMFLLSPELGLYTHIIQGWETYGSVEQDGWHIMRKTLPPYRLVETGEIKGLIGITYITDKKCGECYDPKVHKEGLARMMPGYGEEKSVDVNSIEGQELVLKYDIGTVPTVVLSSDVGEYVLFESLFGNVYSKQSDGNYLFVGNDRLGLVYEDLKSGEIVNS